VTADRPAGASWWRGAVVYQVYLRSFADGNGDGVGDLAGLRARLAYLVTLGVDAIWINPWYPSPMVEALVEKERPGGVCLNWGCIPTKAMLRSADVLETMRHSAEYGVLADNVRLDYPAVLQRKERVVKGLTDGVARRLVESMRSTPHLYLTTSVDAEELMRLRAELDVSANDLVVKACAVLLAANPELNVSWGGDRLLAHRRVHVGIAVAVDGGLLVPVIRDADRKTITQVSREARELIARARAGRLAAAELTVGTFTVSNLGMFGIDQFTAVINPPEAAILAVGAALAEPVITDDDGVTVRRRMRLTLSIDHRALDGATGAGFLQQLKSVLEHPLRIVA
jgi:pyruvate/2-oxoglutarate dehydrogenase complex dihydrolipoamide acyltransferase (E2) component